MSTASRPVVIRHYQPADSAGTLLIFLAAITRTASADYSPEQVRAWAAPDRRDPADWHRAMAARNSFVAMVDGDLSGFSDVTSDGYIDMMFVAPEYQRRGIATRLLAEAEALARAAGATELSANVSITARPLFEANGFEAVTEQHPVRRGISLTNFRMVKALQ